MKLTLWGTRGSLPTPGESTVRYGGNTSCVEVRSDADTVLVLDAGTGIRPLGDMLAGKTRRIDLLLSHLHMDHIQGLGFFEPLLEPDLEVHIWGPSSTTDNLEGRLARYLSPPLFPVRIRDLPCNLTVHNLALGRFEIQDVRIWADLVCHPPPTVGYRIEDGDRSMAYLPDHEPALGCRNFPDESAWTSGFELARGVDVLIHDAQYTSDEYGPHAGWGHSSMEQAVAFAGLAGARRLVTFHHAPAHSDADLDALIDSARAALASSVELIAGTEGAEITV